MTGRCEICCATDSHHGDCPLQFTGEVRESPDTDLVSVPDPDEAVRVLLETTTHYF